MTGRNLCVMPLEAYLVFEMLWQLPLLQDISEIWNPPAMSKHQSALAGAAVDTSARPIPEAG